jgi:uncharacterized protein YecE (DUF72 family)
MAITIDSILGVYSNIIIIMYTNVLIGTSGWKYDDPIEKGGWIGVFYPDIKTKFLKYYSQFFNTVEFDAIFYEKFYSKMTRGTLSGLSRASPDRFQFSVKVPETITHLKKMNVAQGAYWDFEKYLDILEPLKSYNKLGTILFQLPPYFTADYFSKIEPFLDKLPGGYDYAVEFRHSSWHTEGALELLKHYNIASVLTDSPDPGLQFLSEPVVTADHAFIRFHGRNRNFWYNYLYSKQELDPWINKVNQIAQQVKTLRIYFNNHFAGAAIINSIQFEEMLGKKIQEDKKQVLDRAELFYMQNRQH